MTVEWIVWVVWTLASFGVLEWLGYKRFGIKGTLSYKVWSLIFYDADRRLVGKVPRKIRFYAYWPLLGALGAVMIHFFLGGRLG